jgi:hypothetical protein
MALNLMEILCFPLYFHSRLLHSAKTLRKFTTAIQAYVKENEAVTKLLRFPDTFSEPQTLWEVEDPALAKAISAMNDVFHAAEEVCVDIIY